MSQDQPDFTGLTARIVSGYVAHNSLPIDRITTLIEAVSTTLRGLVQPVAEPEPKQQPAVSVRRSVKPDAIICIECGRSMKMLKRHLKTDHDLSPEDYKVRWNLPSDYPLVAPDYADQRRAMAKRIGLGRQPRS